MNHKHPVVTLSFLLGHPLYIVYLFAKFADDLKLLYVPTTATEPARRFHWPKKYYNWPRILEHTENFMRTLLSKALFQWRETLLRF